MLSRLLRLLAKRSHIALVSSLLLAACVLGAAAAQIVAPIYIPFVPNGSRTATPASDKWVMAYYVGYQRDLLPPSEIDWSTLTHLAVGRATPNADGSLKTTFDIDAVQGPQMARDLTQRAHAANRKAILMLGGGGEHDGFVGAASPQRRAAFVNNILGTVDELGFDGVDVDWEPIEASDRPNLLALLKALRTARPDLLITIPVNWASSNFPFSAEEKAFYAEVGAQVDQLNIMTYDMSGDWDGWDSWFQGALRGESPTHPSSVESSVAQFLGTGVPARKLGIGVAFYGTCWQGVSEPRVRLAGSGATMLASDNTMSYANIVTQYYQSAAYRFDSAAQVPYLSSAAGLGPNKCTYMSYENADSTAAKGAYARSQGLGGAILWTIGQGHIASAPAGNRDPLMQAMKAAFLAP